MKKLIILAATMLTVVATYGQSKELESFNKKLAKNEATIAKKGETAALLVAKSAIYIDAANAHTSKLIQGLPLDQTTALIGQPQSTEQVTIADIKYNKHIFPHFDLYTNEQNFVAFWIPKTVVVENALKLSYDVLVKAKSIDPKYFENKGKGALAAEQLQGLFQTDGMAFYTLNKSKEASVLFLQSVHAGELFNSLDTTYLYYAGIASLEDKNLTQAQGIFEKLLSVDYTQEGMVYFYLSQIFMDSKDYNNAIEILETGFAKFPGNKTLLNSTINAYVLAKKDQSKIIELIKQAQSLDTANISLILVEASIFNEMGDKPSAYKSLERASKQDPLYFSAYYNYAIMKILEAEDLRKDAEKLDINDTDGYNKMLALSFSAQKDAIVKLEKAHELQPKNFDVVDLLKQLYFPRRDEAKEQYEKYEKLALELSAAPAE